MNIHLINNIIVSLSAAEDTATSASTQVNESLFSIALEKIYYFIMVPMVYIALIFFAAALIWKITELLLAPGHPNTLKVFPKSKFPRIAAMADALGMMQIRKHKPLFWVFLMIFHISFVLLILGHLDILPEINIMPAGSKHMIGNGFTGLGIIIPLFYFLIRRFKSPNREISLPADYLLLLFIIFLSLLGALMSWGNSWTPNGFVMTKQDFVLYFDGLVKFTFADPKAVLHGSHYHFAVLHVLFAEIFLFILPFTKIMHAFFTIPVNLLKRI